MTRFKQSICRNHTPCTKGKVEYKMRKSSKTCCRKKSHKRIGPSRISSSPWIKFLKSKSNKGYSRNKLSSLYHKTHRSESSRHSKPTRSDGKRRKLSPSRGWKRMSPHKGRERNLIYQKCGSKCFLEPSKLGFPICKSYRKKSGRMSCLPDSKAVLSAYRRAKQWKHESTARKAVSIAKERKFDWYHHNL